MCGLHPCADCISLQTASVCRRHQHADCISLQTTSARRLHQFAASVCRLHPHADCISLQTTSARRLHQFADYIRTQTASVCCISLQTTSARRLHGAAFRAEQAALDIHIYPAQRRIQRRIRGGSRWAFAGQAHSWPSCVPRRREFREPGDSTATAGASRRSVAAERARHCGGQVSLRRHCDLAVLISCMRGVGDAGCVVVAHRLASRNGVGIRDSASASLRGEGSCHGEHADSQTAQAVAYIPTEHRRGRYGRGWKRRTGEVSAPSHVTPRDTRPARDMPRRKPGTVAKTPIRADSRSVWPCDRGSVAHGTAVFPAWPRPLTLLDFAGRGRRDERSRDPGHAQRPRASAVAHPQLL